ncbi:MULTISPECIES: type II toxin-antitoxin system RelB/DinJ family antitoxin [Enterococcus]|uniref:RelB/DinJ family addiction module antitoxin n=1 Tax=Enterococcus mundtii TaxID=53346 RepID=A0A2T5DE51_ENTMU|nr:type II toxin-antitoxin system RelB/DinJ family antitoxin [Enterococcus mundtii]MBE6172929.1 RelB/DinJ family addiction module antitoxin [Enterococcus faecium]MBO1085464.1 RelB/DinJ family addiction module antitoxin [Enterococcus mundtii]MDB7101212.1 type II toxin-antitoxin system RelB/DinJ family antitoxin [Enterococcus mundtii]MDV7745753.1 type II toxin-antitoxin system RelB/DinJ family antitoxin [Enterococcus mundtii]PTO36216.1 RelB/DinJ family addiction module antitoxin [Enterococcus mu
MSEIKEKNKTNEKKKVQVNINKNLATDVESILDSLGVNPSILITALYKRVAARGEIPFDLSLTSKEKVELQLMRVAEESVETNPPENSGDHEDLVSWTRDLDE